MNTTHSTRPAGAPAYFLGRPATVWQIALRRSPQRAERAMTIIKPISIHTSST